MSHKLCMIVPLLFTLLSTQKATADDNLPTPTTVLSLEMLKQELNSGRQPASSQGPQWFQHSSTINQTVPTQNASSGANTLPLAGGNRILINIERNVDLRQLIQDIAAKDATIVDVFQNLGQILIETDITRFIELPDPLNYKSANLITLEAVITASQEFNSIPGVRSASPDSLLTGQATSLGGGRPIFQSVNFASDIENEDWGLEDIRAKEIWAMPGADEGVIVGIVDVGFAKHNDITFSRFRNNTPKNDHGNHVSGIACAKHNGIGIKGVVPNCFVRAISPVSSAPDAGANQLLDFFASFSDIQRELNSFLVKNDDIKTFNLSLGYNWASNFSINPDSDDAKLYRTLVEMQGKMALSTYELAAENDSVIFSSSGNDSTNTAAPIEAKYASPFNWAAIVGRERGVFNGVVVEAHDKQGTRASFSNNMGHISCPGVSILSAVSTSKDGYGLSSGTSMASPYCAGAHALLTLVLRGVDPIGVADCMLEHSTPAEDGAPKLDMVAAFEGCQ